MMTDIDAEAIVDDIMDDLRDEVSQRVQSKLAEIETRPDEEDTDKSVPRVEELEDLDDFDAEAFHRLWSKPYLLQQDSDTEYTLYVPNCFTDFEVGEFIGHGEDKRFRMYRLTPTTAGLHGIPDCVANDDRIDIERDDRFRVEGAYIYYDREDRDELEQYDDITDHLRNIGPTSAAIRDGHEYMVMEAMLRHGFFPFTPHPIEDDDWSEPTVSFPFDLYDYQWDWIDHIKDNGHGCFVGPTGSGKSVPTTYLFAGLDGTHALICYGRMTLGQWQQYLDDWADLNVAVVTDDTFDPDSSDIDDYDVVLATYQSVDKIHAIVRSDNNDLNQFNAIATDESHAITADTFAAAASIPTEYKWGMTASPYREDGREEAIQAFTGPYIGMDWDAILDEQDKARHTVEVHIVDDEQDKVEVAADLYDPDQRTLIYSDSIDLGNAIADRLGVPSVNGQDGHDQYDRILAAIEEYGVCVVSRVGDHGISIDGLEAIIECSFLYGSRNQSLQRTGRLLHDDAGNTHHVVFTDEQWDRHHKRLFSQMDRGFEIVLPDGVEIPQDYSGHSNLDIELDTGERVDAQDYATTNTVTTDFDDDLDFLRCDIVQDEITDIIDDEWKEEATKDNVRKALATLAQSDEPMQANDISDILGVSNSVIRNYMRPFHDRTDGPPLIATSSNQPYEFRHEAVAEIVEAREKRQQAESIVEELKG